MSVHHLIESFANLKILIIGDAMVDAYYFGNVERISPEAPVPIISVSKKNYRPGGAANVALNIKSMGAKAILCSVVGDDIEGQELINLINKEGIETKGVLIDPSRPTTMKTRVISGNHHLLRIDHETTRPLNEDLENQMIRFINENIDHIDAIIMEDYNKGLLTARIIEEVISMANKNNKPTIVDPKKENFFAYKNCTLFKPNRIEIKEGLKTDLDLSIYANIEKCADKLVELLGCKNVMVTLSEDGVFIKTAFQSSHINAHPRTIIDVSGAGDTVVSVAALCLAAGMELTKMAEIANLAGGLVCEKVGVLPINTEELINEITRLGL